MDGLSASGRTEGAATPEPNFAVDEAWLVDWTRHRARSGSQTHSQLTASGSLAPGQSKACPCQLLMDPTQIEQTVDLPHQMMSWDHPVQVKRIEELSLPIFPPTHHPPLPLTTLYSQSITDRESPQREFGNRIRADRKWHFGAVRTIGTPRRHRLESARTHAGASHKSLSGTKFPVNL
jgi:hypothetical protein